MSVSIAEYLGQRTDLETPQISPVPNRIEIPCPFMNANCDKVKKGYKPVCSVRKANGTLWIVCRHRLCATSKNITFSQYQQSVLMKVAQTIYNTDIQPDNVLVKREVPMYVTDNSSYKADFIMVNNSNNSSPHGPNRVVLEMQGGGETSNTGKITSHISAWENTSNRSNAFLGELIGTVGTIETNAWRRQQEQFLVKGRIAMQTGTGCGMVFCVGTILYDYLWSRVNSSNLRDLREHYWTLALIGFKEDTNAPSTPGPLKLTIDPEKTLFTDYQNFVRVITDVGQPSPESFRGEFNTLSGNTITLS